MHPLPTALHFLGTLAISTLIVAAVIALAIALLRLLSDRVQVIDVCDGCGRRMDQHKMASRPGGPCSGMCARCFEAANPAAGVAASSMVEAVATPEPATGFDIDMTYPPEAWDALVKMATPDDRAVMIRAKTDAMAIPILPGFEGAEETETYGPKESM